MTLVQSYAYLFVQQVVLDCDSLSQVFPYLPSGQEY